jgi:hypothetical protein
MFISSKHAHNARQHVLGALEQRLTAYIRRHAFLWLTWDVSPACLAASATRSEYMRLLFHLQMTCRYSDSVHFLQSMQYIINGRHHETTCVYNEVPELEHYVSANVARSRHVPCCLLRPSRVATFVVTETAEVAWIFSVQVLVNTYYHASTMLTRKQNVWSRGPLLVGGAIDAATPCALTQHKPIV